MSGLKLKKVPQLEVTNVFILVIVLNYDCSIIKNYKKFKSGQR